MKTKPTPLAAATTCKLADAADRLDRKRRALLAAANHLGIDRLEPAHRWDSIIATIDDLRRALGAAYEAGRGSK